MVYNKYIDSTIDIIGFDNWYDKQFKRSSLLVDDILPQVANSGGLHEYSGISTDWRFTYTGRGIF